MVYDGLIVVSYYCYLVVRMLDPISILVVTDTNQCGKPITKTMNENFRPSIFTSNRFQPEL